MVRKEKNKPEDEKPVEYDRSIHATARSYDEAAEKFHDYYYAGKKAYHAPSVKLGLISFVKRLPKQGLVLDIGCGPGVHTEFIQRISKMKVVGVDFSIGMLNVAKKRYPGPYLAQMDARELGIMDSCCNGIWASCLVHHIPRAQTEQLVKELYRIAAPGCVVYVITNRGKRECMEGDNVHRYPIGARFFSAIEEEEITKLFKRTGFDILNIKVSEEELIHLFAKKPLIDGGKGGR